MLPDLISAPPRLGVEFEFSLPHDLFTTMSLIVKSPWREGLSEWVYETAAADSYVSTAKAERVLGFSPRFSNTDALLRNYDWYVSQLPAIAQASGISHRSAWKQGIIGLGKYFF